MVLQQESAEGSPTEDGGDEISVALTDDPEEMWGAALDTGSCIMGQREVAEDYFEKFAESDNVHFYVLGDRGYARAVELPTSQGDALAVDAVKTRGNFDIDAYQAGVEAVISHAEDMRMDMVLGGKEFFLEDDVFGGDIDLTYHGDSFTSARDFYFDETVSEEDLRVHHGEKPYSKGEQWDELEEYFVRRL